MSDNNMEHLIGRPLVPFFDGGNAGEEQASTTGSTESKRKKKNRKKKGKNPEQPNQSVQQSVAVRKFVNGYFEEAVDVSVAGGPGRPLVPFFDTVDAASSTAVMQGGTAGRGGAAGGAKGGGGGGKRGKRQKSDKKSHPKSDVVSSAPRLYPKMMNYSQVTAAKAPPVIQDAPSWSPQPGSSRKGQKGHGGIKRAPAGGGNTNHAVYAQTAVFSSPDPSALPLPRFLSSPPSSSPPPAGKLAASGNKAASAALMAILRPNRTASNLESKPTLPPSSSTNLAARESLLDILKPNRKKTPRSQARVAQQSQTEHERNLKYASKTSASLNLLSMLHQAASSGQSPPISPVYSATDISQNRPLPDQATAASLVPPNIHVQASARSPSNSSPTPQPDLLSMLKTVSPTNIAAFSSSLPPSPQPYSPSSSNARQHESEVEGLSSSLLALLKSGQ